MAAVKELIAEGHHKVRETPEKRNMKRREFVGAAIGAGVGAGGGAGVQAAGHGAQVKIPSETKIDFTLKAPVTVTINQAAE